MSCPKCKSDVGVIPIFYGEPSQKQLDMEKRGEVVIGGCVFSSNSPTFHCKKCNLDFSEEIL
jgi:hypothetical protein